jgi:hypothetical protein
MDNLSFSCPKNCGLSQIATTAFWTVDLVTSAGRFMSSLESNCRVHEMPKRDEACLSGLTAWRRLK